MFKFRFGGQGGSSPTQPPSIETVRRRARHRLLGASLLVLAGVIGFPLLFESQPRPVQTNFEIEIPSRKTAQPLAAAGNAAPATGARVEGLDEKEEIVTPAPVAQQPMPAQQGDAAPAQPFVKPWEKQPAVSGPTDKPAADKPVAAVKTEKKPEPKPAAKPPGDAARALALLEGRAPQQGESASDDKSVAKSRHIVQVGAFVDPVLAREARMKLERAGLSTYTHVADTPDGKRTRVRLGPFSSRAEAQKAADKARALGLSVSILTL